MEPFRVSLEDTSLLRMSTTSHSVVYQPNCLEISGIISGENFGGAGRGTWLSP